MSAKHNHSVLRKLLSYWTTWMQCKESGYRFWIQISASINTKCRCSSLALSVNIRAQKTQNSKENEYLIACLLIVHSRDPQTSGTFHRQVSGSSAFSKQEPTVFQSHTSLRNVSLFCVLAFRFSLHAIPVDR